MSCQRCQTSIQTRERQVLIVGPLACSSNVDAAAATSHRPEERPQFARMLSAMAVLSVCAYCCPAVLGWVIV